MCVHVRASMHVRAMTMLIFLSGTINQKAILFLQQQARVCYLRYHLFSFKKQLNCCHKYIPFLGVTLQQPNRTIHLNECDFFWSLSLIMTCSGSYKPSPNHTGPHWQTCDISLDIALRNLSARTRQQSAEWSLPSPFICKSTFSFNCIIPIEVKQTVNWACSLQACREGRATRR